MSAGSDFWDAAGAARWRSLAEARARYLGRPTLRMLDAAELSPGDAVLDLGTGTGDSALLAGRRVGATGRVLATDLSAAMLAGAAAAVAAAGLANVETRVMDAAAIDVEPESFDAVIARLSLQFVPDLAAAMAGVNRALRSGGRLAALVWDAAESNRFMLAALDGVEQAGFERPADPTLLGPFQLGDRGRLEAELRRAGLVDVTVERISLERRFSTLESAAEAVWESTIGAAVWRDLDGERRPAVAARVLEILEAGRSGDELAFPGALLLLSGTC